MTGNIIMLALEWIKFSSQLACKARFIGLEVWCSLISKVQWATPPKKSHGASCCAISLPPPPKHFFRWNPDCWQFLFSCSAGEALDIYEILEKTNGSLQRWDTHSSTHYICTSSLMITMRLTKLSNNVRCYVFVFCFFCFRTSQHIVYSCWQYIAMSHVSLYFDLCPSAILHLYHGLSNHLYGHVSRFKSLIWSCEPLQMTLKLISRMYFDVTRSED